MIVLVVAGIVSIVSLAVAILSSPVGRFCDDRIGAIGHPYWQFTDGKLYLWTCGQRTFEGTYRRTASGWEVISVSKKGVTNTSPLEVHWWGLATGVPPDQYSCHRCWHLWMNSSGPLWHPWD